MNKIIALFLCVVMSVPSFARRHLRIFHRGPAAIFTDGHFSQLAQNAEIDRLGLPRIANDRQLSALVEREDLVPILPMFDLETHKPILTLSPTLRKRRNAAYVRPFVLRFLIDFSSQFYAEFGLPLQVNSAVRPATVQAKLRRVNRNAAPIKGDTASAHMAGVAVDLQRRGYTDAQVRWLQLHLLMYRAKGEVIVIEELAHPCFHVMVTGAYPLPVPVPTEDANPGTPVLLPEPVVEQPFDVLQDASFLFPNLS